MSKQVFDEYGDQKFNKISNSRLESKRQGGKEYIFDGVDSKVL